jgi:hypothetical protein
MGAPVAPSAGALFGVVVSEYANPGYNGAMIRGFDSFGKKIIITSTPRVEI